jgi:hypothetical protein
VFGDNFVEIVHYGGEGTNGVSAATSVGSSAFRSGNGTLVEVSVPAASGDWVLQVVRGSLCPDAVLFTALFKDIIRGV